MDGICLHLVRLPSCVIISGCREESGNERESERESEREGERVKEMKWGGFVGKERERNNNGE